MKITVYTALVYLNYDTFNYYVYSTFRLLTVSRIDQRVIFFILSIAGIWLLLVILCKQQSKMPAISNKCNLLLGIVYYNLLLGMVYYNLLLGIVY